jgi:hypothetical protein
MGWLPSPWEGLGEGVSRVGSTPFSFFRGYASARRPTSTVHRRQSRKNKRERIGVPYFALP